MLIVIFSLLLLFLNLKFCLIRFILFKIPLLIIVSCKIKIKINLVFLFLFTNIKCE